MSELDQLHAQVWALAEGASLAAAFDGRALLAPLLRGHVTRISPPYLPYISAISPRYLPLISPISPLLRGHVREDPSARLLENAALLFSAARRSAHPAAIAAAVREARSLLYLTLTLAPNPNP